MLTYLKAAAPLVPGASRLPWVAGGGGDMPPLERSLRDVRAERDRVAAYSRVCGFGLRDELPPTYPHILAFPLHMQLMTDGRFPFPAIGLVHLSNRISVHRPPTLGEPFDLDVRVTPIQPHPKGRTFSLVTEARAGGELVWEEESTILRRGGGGDGGGGGSLPEGEQLPASGAEWRLPGDLGRRYAAVSGDSNPIHLHPLSARLLGFPRAIAHGMWTKARCLAAMEARLPGSFEVDVTFRKPILLPGRVGFGAGDDGRFAVRSISEDDVIHLEGKVTR